ERPRSISVQLPIPSAVWMTPVTSSLIGSDLRITTSRAANPQAASVVMAYSAVVAPVSAPQNSSGVSWSATGSIGSAGGASVSGADDVVLMLSSLAADPFALCERIFSLRGRTWACTEERTGLWKPFGRPQAMDGRVVRPSTTVGVEVAVQELLAQSSRR